MKRFIKAFSIFTATAVFILSCTQQIGYKAPKTADGKILVSFAPSYDSVYTAENNERTAIPTVDFTGYTYDLDYIEGYLGNQKPQANAFSGRTYTQLSQAFALNPENYQFVLTAKKDGAAVLRGEAIANISETSGSKIVFMMYPVAGSTGDAKITVWFPLHGPIAKVTASVSEDIFTAGVETELKISHESGVDCVRYTPSGLASGVTQFASLKFYDESGQLLYELIESLQIVGGCTSISQDITLTDDDWHSYPVIVQLKKDNQLWNGSGKKLELKLKSDLERAYTLQETSQGYTASVGEGTYYIYIDNENTGVELNSVNKTISLDYYTVSLSASTFGCKLVPVSGGLDVTDSSVVVRKTSSLTYKIQLLAGYEEAASGVVIKENNVTKTGYKLDTEYAINSIDKPVEIAVSGLQDIVYSISYSWGSDVGIDGASFIDEDAVPRSYTAKTVVELPKMENVKRNGYFFDAWVLKTNNKVVVNTTENYAQNLELVATWKEGVYVDLGYKKIYANGINLLIEKNATNGATNVFVDMNGNGVKNEEDIQVIADNGETDFTGYSLFAASKNGDAPNSNFTFTMTGGNLSSIYGLGKDRSNKSELKISGDSTIGKVASPTIETDYAGNELYYYASAEGVLLNTFTNEVVTITDALASTSRIILISDYEYVKGVDRYVTTQINKDWINYSNFACYADLTMRTVSPESDNSPKRYFQNLLTMATKLVNGVTKAQVRFAPTTGVDFPTEEEIIAAGGDIVEGFTLGENKVVSECSVFSISIENGVFWVNERTTFTNNTTEDEKQTESKLVYMVQPTATTYEESLAFKDSNGNVKTYIYMHITSTNENKISSETASDFLAQIKFKKTDPAKKMKIKVNLETVETSEIQQAGVIYFDGSWYKKMGNYEWRNAYNAAKQQVFNGMHGYLMNITSEVENNYIYTKYGSVKAWFGASRMGNLIDGKLVFDADSYAVNGTDAIQSGSELSGWYWMSGPEAGSKFWDSKTYYIGGDSRKGPAYVYIDEKDKSKGYWYTNWNTNTPEPNNSGNEWCLQFLVGNGQKGKWNDINNSKHAASAGGDYVINNIFVEFTPYKNEWNEEVAKSRPIKSECTY